MWLQQCHKRWVHTLSHMAFSMILRARVSAGLWRSSIRMALHCFFSIGFVFVWVQGGSEPRVRLPPSWQQRYMQMGEQLVAPVEVDAQRPRKVAVVGPIGQVGVPVCV